MEHFRVPVRPAVEWPGHGHSDGSRSLAREFILFVELVIDGVDLGIFKILITPVDIFEPSGVRAEFAAIMVEGVVVEGELRALVVKVDLLLAVEFALELVGDLGRGDSVPEVVN